MKNDLLRFVADNKNNNKAYAKFTKPTAITAGCTPNDLFQLVYNIREALSHFIDEYDWTKSHLKMIAEATVCWHYCYRNNNLMYGSDNDAYLSNYAKDFYNELAMLNQDEFGAKYSKSNKLNCIESDNPDNLLYSYFLTEDMFKLIISKVNEVVTHTLNDGSTVENLKDLSDFFNQAIPCWERMKTNPSVFQAQS